MCREDRSPHEEKVKTFKAGSIGFVVPEIVLADAQEAQIEEPLELDTATLEEAIDQCLRVKATGSGSLGQLFD
jgi:hypothetical protein